MSAPDFSLLAKRRFGPMFVVQFIGAFNDNALKYAMLFLVTFTLYKGDENGAASLAALATGLAYDRVGGRVLFTMPVLVGLVPALAFGGGLPTVLLGVAVWGLATGILDSTVKALVSDIVPRGQLATAYGWFATFQGLAALAGGAAAGALYARHLGVLVGLVLLLQILSLALLARTLRTPRQPPAT